MAQPVQNTGPRILCYVEGDGPREAKIVGTFAEVIAFIEEQWTGVDEFRAPDYGNERDEVAERPDRWNDGRHYLQFDFENGLLALTFLGDGTWHDEWNWIA